MILLLIYFDIIKVLYKVMKEHTIMEEEELSLTAIQ